MKYLLFAIVLISLSCSTLKQNTTKNTAFNWERTFIPIMQGASSKSRTTINFIVPKSFTYKVVATNSKTKDKLVFNTKVRTTSESFWNIIELDFKGLSLTEEYSLSVTISRKSYSYTDTRIFKSFDTKKKKHKLSVSSCMADTYLDIGNQAWASIQKKDVDAYLLIGDVVYVDYHNGRYTGQSIKRSHEIWSRHIDARNSLTIYRLKELKPVFAIWDDHDLGINNGNRKFKHIKKAKKYFRDFFPLQESDSLNIGHGVGFALKLGDHNFSFLDNRSFRDDNDLKSGEHLGAKQTKWLLENIKQSDGTNWLIQGDQFFGAYHPFESFEGKHPKKFQALLENLKKLGEKYVFISGDRHLFELMKIEKDQVGHETYEITTSGIHAKNFPGSGNKLANPRREKVIDDKYTSLLINLNETKANYDVLDHKGNILHHKKITLEGSRP